VSHRLPALPYFLKKALLQPLYADTTIYLTMSPSMGILSSVFFFNITPNIVKKKRNHLGRDIIN
jgi:hypothetical protein